MKKITFESSDTTEQAYHERFVQQAMGFSFWGALVFLVSYLILALIFPGFPFFLLGVGAGVAIALAILHSATKQGYSRTAAMIYAVMATAVVFFSMYYMGGPKGPLAVTLPVLSIIIGALLGHKVANHSLLINSVYYGGYILLETLGVVTSRPLSDALSSAAWVLMLVVSSGILVTVNEQYLSMMGTSMSAFTQRSRELAVANQRAQAAVEAERRLRQHDIEVAQQFDATLKQFVTFLEHVRAGDYTSRLDLTELAENKNLPLELINLGRYLNVTVESLLDALTSVQAVQQTYVKQSWETLSETAAMARGYHFLDGEVEVVEEAWLEPMSDAVYSQQLFAEDRRLAIPLNIRGQIIGAMGVRRDTHDPWSREELEIVNEIADQLAQTIENLRLLDDTNRRAAREEAVGDITAKIRAEVEIEAVLERALVELGQVLQADRGSAHLALGQSQEESV